VPECTAASFLDAKLVAMRVPESTGATAMAAVAAPDLDFSPIMSPVVPVVNRPSSPLLQDGGEGDDELGDDDDSLSRDDDDDEGDEEEEEPRLKYQRLGGSVPSLLSSDAASCLTIAERIIVLGTHDGSVHLLDFRGNQVLSSVSLFLSPPRSPSLSPFSHAHHLPHATIVTFECLKSGSQMRVAHKKNRHLRVLLWKWDTASRLSFRRTEHLLNSERNLPRGTNKYLCLKNQQKPFCFDVCFQSCVKMFLGLFEAQICSCDPPLVGAAGKRVSPCPHSNSERGEH
jgi:hypothetical protein